jgi:hypothetical protein|tara:strand:+ start:144 stop:1373 length:1230 start_codon:yes stop_codon:yes gene_type:complete
MSVIKSDIANNTMEGVNDTVDKAKEEFIKMLKNKNKWGLIFLIMVIIFLVWILSLYIRGKLRLKASNNQRMIDDYESLGGTKIGGINSSNANHKFLLRDYYVAGSYNSCCGGNVEKDFVDMVPLRTVIKQGARVLDFEIYSINAEPVVAAGPGPNTNGKYCLKGTYNHISFKKAMSYVRMLAFNGAQCPNSDDPLFLSFRIKTNNRSIYPIMANIISRAFDGRFLGPKYSNNGKFNKSGADIIANIPILNLKNKVIIMIQDPTNNYRQTEFEEFVNMSGKGNDGAGLPFVTFYKNIDIVQAYDPEALKEQNKKFLGITMPDFTKITTNPPATIHHSYGCQLVLMNYSVVDQNMIYYLNFFNKRGSAFRLKPDHLRYFETKIPPPRKQKKELSYGPRQASMLGGAYKPSL